MTLTATTERDVEFFNAVYSLMNNSFPEMLDRFGIWRSHQHFELETDEVFHETSDTQNKESTLRIIKKTELPKDAFVSAWKLTPNGPLAATWCCDYKPNH